MVSSQTVTIEALRERILRLPRYPLAHLPTPLEHLPRLSRALGGPQIFMKRDDCTGLALGGNKTRHNEFLLADAVAQGADLFVWGAGVQSNNCRQTTAACAKAGIDCHLILTRGGSSAGTPPIQGNLLLDHLLGASYEFVDAPIGEELDRIIDDRAAAFRAAGRRVYQWDRVRTKPLAAVSYALCLVEIVEQARQAGFTPDAVYVSSSGSTGSGLAIGAAAIGAPFPVRSICPIEWSWDTQEDMAEIANCTAELIGVETRLARADMEITFDYIAPGYGQSSAGGLEAIELTARTEGIVLDAIYSGKAMAGLIDHVRTGRLHAGQNVVFVHTGGTPALFAQNEELAKRIAPRRL